MSAIAENVEERRCAASQLAAEDDTLDPERFGRCEGAAEALAWVLGLVEQEKTQLRRSSQSSNIRCTTAVSFPRSSGVICAADAVTRPET